MLKRNKKLNRRLQVLLQIDIEAVLRIEQAVQIHPWSQLCFMYCYAMPHCYGWLSVIDDQPVGFILILLQQAECQVLNIGVDPGWQRQGVGQQLLMHALSYAKQYGGHKSYLEVRMSNIAALKLYQKVGFDIVGERKQYYRSLNGTESALILVKDENAFSG